MTITIAESRLRRDVADAADAADVGWMGNSCVSSEAARRLSCDAGVIEVIEDEHGVPLSVGRKRRTIAGSIKRALLKRDTACSFPGCTHQIFLEGHHLVHWVHWADGGETTLENAALLCTRYHRYVHEYGYTVELGSDKRPRFRDPSGRLVAAVPARNLGPELGWPQLRAANEPLAIDADAIACEWDGSPVDYARVIDELVVVDRGLPISRKRSEALPCPVPRGPQQLSRALGRAVRVGVRAMRRAISRVGRRCHPARPRPARSRSRGGVTRGTCRAQRKKPTRKFSRARKVARRSRSLVDDLAPADHVTAQVVIARGPAAAALRDCPLLPCTAGAARERGGLRHPQVPGHEGEATLARKRSFGSRVRSVCRCKPVAWLTIQASDGGAIVRLERIFSWPGGTSMSKDQLTDQQAHVGTAAQDTAAPDQAHGLPPHVYAQVMALGPADAPILADLLSLYSGLTTRILAVAAPQVGNAAVQRAIAIAQGKSKVQGRQGSLNQGEMREITSDEPAATRPPLPAWGVGEREMREITSDEPAAIRPPLPAWGVGEREMREIASDEPAATRPPLPAWGVGEREMHEIADEPAAAAKPAGEPAWVGGARKYNAAHAELVADFNDATGSRCLDASGQLDPQAVRRWQAAHGIGADGRVGPHTLAAARQASAKAGPAGAASDQRIPV